MGKGLRSKAKRRNRNEFRTTIGQDAAAKNMEKVQEKLQECIGKGTLNSFERISKILSGGGDGGGDGDNSEDTDMNGGMKINSKPLVGKSPDRVPTGKKDIVTKSKIRGRKKGAKVSLRSSSKKKKSKA